MKTWKWMWLCCAVAAAGCGDAGSRRGGATLELYPAEESEGRDWRCRDYNGRCVVLAAEPVARIDSPRFDVVAGERPALSIQLPATQRLALARAADGGRPRRLAVVVDGRVQHVAKLRGPLAGDALMLSFCNEANLARVVDALRPAR
jgi:preprotein translocase subunit SecD